MAIVCTRQTRCKPHRQLSETTCGCVISGLSRAYLKFCKSLGSVEIDRIDVGARHEALDIERLELLRGERDELPAIVFVSFNDLRFLDLLARLWVMRAQRDPSGCTALIGSGGRLWLRSLRS